MSDDLHPDLLGVSPEEHRLELDTCNREHTGERVRERNPRLYQSIIAQLRIGRSDVKIAKELKCSPGTVAAVRRQNSVLVVDGKKELRRELLVSGYECLAAAHQRALAEGVSPLVTGTVGGICLTHAEKLGESIGGDGEENVAKRDRMDDARRAVEELIERRRQAITLAPEAATDSVSGGKELQVIEAKDEGKQ